MYRRRAGLFVLTITLSILGCTGGIGGSGSRHTSPKTYSTGWTGGYKWTSEKNASNPHKSKAKYEYVAPFAGTTHTLPATPVGIRLGVRVGAAAAGLSDRERGFGTAWELHLTATTRQWTFTGGYGRQSGDVGTASISFGGWIAELGRRLDFVPMRWGLDLVVLLGIHGGPGVKIQDLEENINVEYEGWALRPALRLTKLLGRIIGADAIAHLDLRYTHSETLFGDVRYRGPSMLAECAFSF